VPTKPCCVGRVGANYCLTCPIALTSFIPTVKGAKLTVEATVPSQYARHVFTSRVAEP
jgi:hypothetical protein